MAEIDTVSVIGPEDSAVTDSKPSSRRILFLGLGLVLAAGAGGAAWLLLRSKPAPPTAKTKPATEVKTVLHLEGFIVNLADAEENRFLRVGIDLGVDQESSEGSAEQKGTSQARIRDTILTVLTTWRSDALLAPHGKTKLKEDLLRALRERVPELGVREVYFSDFLVQR